MAENGDGQMMSDRCGKIGLVLSGGGAKGAYHVGMFRALEEYGLAENISVISGCSIGAYNALLYAAGGTAAMRRFLHRFGRLMLTDEGRYSTEGLRRELMKELRGAAFDWRQRRLVACAYSLKTLRPEYFELSALGEEEAATIAAASGALPQTFPPVCIDGVLYTDGGVVPPGYCSAAQADKIPLRPIADADVDQYLIAFLNPDNQIDRSLVREGKQCLELRPSRYLEPSPGAGTLDFSPELLESHESLGYTDTLALIENTINTESWGDR